MYPTIVTQRVNIEWKWTILLQPYVIPLPWNFSKTFEEIKSFHLLKNNFSYPLSLGKAFADFVRDVKWKSFIVLYETEVGVLEFIIPTLQIFFGIIQFRSNFPLKRIRMIYVTIFRNIPALIYWLLLYAVTAAVSFSL